MPCIMFLVGSLFIIGGIIGFVNNTSPSILLLLFGLLIYRESIIIEMKKYNNTKETKNEN